MSESRPRNRQELQAEIIAKAMQDDAFRLELLNNPTETIVKELGLEYLPNGPKFHVLEETPENFYMVLPMRREQIASLAGEAGELSDEDLEVISGGATRAALRVKPSEHD